MTRIGIILGSTRPGRNGEQVAQWVYDIATQSRRRRVRADRPADYPLPAPRRADAAVAGPVPARAHQGVGREDRLLRRVRHRHPGVQPRHLRRAEERASTTSTPSGTTRPSASSPTARSAALARWSTCAWSPASCRWPTYVNRSRSRCSPTSRTSVSSSPATTTSRHSRRCWTRSSPGAPPSRRCASQARPPDPSSWDNCRACTRPEITPAGAAATLSLKITP